MMQVLLSGADKLFLLFGFFLINNVFFKNSKSSSNTRFNSSVNIQTVSLRGKKYSNKISYFLNKTKLMTPKLL